MATFSLSCNLIHSSHTFQSLLPQRRIRINCCTVPIRRPRVYESKGVKMEIRKCPPCLESELLLLQEGGSSISTSTFGSTSTSPNEWKTVPDIWRSSAEKYGDLVAVEDPYHNPPTNMTYIQLEQEILNFSEGLRVIGVKPEEKLALFADNSCRWLVVDQGIMAIGAINVVRGSRSSNEELLQIYNHSESVALAVDSPELLNRIAGTFSSRGADLRFAVLLWGDKSSLDVNSIKKLPIYTYEEIIGIGRESRRALLDSHDARQQYVYETIRSDAVATLVYTSGTTGNPKGVMLTHENLMHQINNLGQVVAAEPGVIFLSMLPTWHAYERAAEYFIFSRGVKQVYTNLRKLKDDLRSYQSHYVISVPLVFETLYRGIQKQIATSSTARKLIAVTFIKLSLVYMEFRRIYEGKCLTKNQKQDSYFVSLVEWTVARFFTAILWPIHMLASKVVYSKIKSSIGMSKAGINGGGSLPLHVDRFFEAIGVIVQNGYGLTECSPVVSARKLDRNVLGSIGDPLQQTEFKVVDPESDEVLPPGSKGLIKVKGPQVMKGYYKNPVATNEVLGTDGWLNTGDIGWIAPHHSVGRSRNCGGIIVLEGRAKDTIVLSTGENVEPSELEEAAMRSNLIQQIVVFGQDQRRLGALIVPNKEEILVVSKGMSYLDENSEFSKDKMMAIINKELRAWTSECSFQIGPIMIVDEPFTIDNGLLTPTMKTRRDKIVALYSKQIENLYK